VCSTLPTIRLNRSLFPDNESTGGSRVSFSQTKWVELIPRAFNNGVSDKPLNRRPGDSYPLICNIFIYTALPIDAFIIHDTYAVIPAKAGMTCQLFHFPKSILDDAALSSIMEISINCTSSLNPLEKFSDHS
jgi:hypothetical protein